MSITQLRISIISCSWCHIKAPALCYPMVHYLYILLFRHETRYDGSPTGDEDAEKGYRDDGKSAGVRVKVTSRQ